MFAALGVTAVQIPVETALAMDNANVQVSAATQPTAEAQTAQEAQTAADTQAAQAALEAQAAQDAQLQAEAQAQAAVTQQPATNAAQGTYTVEANDNLCKIAQKVYGDMKAWREIYKANPVIKDDYIIYKGQILTIPAR